MAIRYSAADPAYSVSDKRMHVTNRIVRCVWQISFPDLIHILGNDPKKCRHTEKEHPANRMLLND